MEYRVRIAFGQSATAVDPDYTDVSHLARIGQGGMTLQSGEESERDDGTHGRLELVLDNRDHRFTEGQAFALTTSLQVEVETIVGGEVFALLSGWTLPPEIDSWTENDGEMLIHISAVDREGWLERDQDMDSLLTEHIRLVGGSRLVGYWPLGEAVEPVGLASVGSTNLVARTSTASNYPATTPPTPLLTPAGGEPAPGDELRPVLFSTYEPVEPSGQKYISVALIGDFSTPVSVLAGSVLTFVYWCRVSPATGFGVQTQSLQVADYNTVLYYQVEHPTLAASPYRGVNLDTLHGSWDHHVDTSAQFAGVTCMVQMRLRPGANPEFRVRGAQDATGVGATVAGSPPATLQVDQIVLASAVTGSIWHLQMYVTTEADIVTDAELRTQWEVGMAGLAGQSADDRIRTLAAFAGIPGGELDLDDCSARMSVLRTLGKTPLQPMREASTTEQGEFHATPDRRLVLRSRSRRYRPSDH